MKNPISFATRGQAGLLPGSIMCICGVGLTFYLLVLSWNVPVLDMYGFRQAQTALTAFWLGKGGPIFGYETPVMGFPWSVPFEFPLYQWFVALASETGLSVDQAGRLIGVAFFLGSAQQLYWLVRRLSHDTNLALCIAGIFLVSPLNVFWGRSVMIESLAVFLGILFLRGLLEFDRTRKPLHGMVAIIAAVLAALVKITTFYGFAVAAAVYEIWYLYGAYKRGDVRNVLPLLALSAVAVGAALIALVAWLQYTDALKQRLIVGESFTSEALSAWNYGTWEQRFDPAFWRDVVFGRSAHQILGSGWVLLGAAAVVCIRKKITPALLLLVLYVVPFLTFTNLHSVHSYYQLANSVFLCAFVGLAISSLDSLRSRIGFFTASAAAVLMCVVSVVHLRAEFIPTITDDYSASRIIRLAKVIRASVSADKVMVGFGLDWSSELPYYSMRRGMMAPDWISAEQLHRMLSRRLVAGDREVGALVICPNGIGRDGARKDVYEKVVALYSQGKSERWVAGCRVYF